MAQVVFRNKVGGTETLTAAAGQPLADVLRMHGIPANAVLSRRGGRVVPESTTVVGPDDLIEVVQVRHYDLDVTRRPSTRVDGATDPVYVKSVLFDRDGMMERRSEQFDERGFVAYVEEAFVQSVHAGGTLTAGEPSVIGLSGGRDSVAYLKLLERTAGRLPTAPMTAVTITGLPDWEEPATFQIARMACESLGIEQVIVGTAEIEATFRLRGSFLEAMHGIVAGEQRHMTMVIGHQVLRRMLERAAEQRGARTVAFGFNADDLVASMVTWFTNGFRMGGIPVRQIGRFKYVFPLYRITKKELTLYLELVAPELTRQGTPGRFTTGPDDRSMAYAISDHLYDLWPGIDYYLFSAMEAMQRYMFPLVEQDCRNCAGTYVLQEGVANPADRCDVCALLAQRELTLPG